MHPDNIVAGNWYAIARWKTKERARSGMFGGEEGALVEKRLFIGYPFKVEAASGVFAVGTFYHPEGQLHRVCMDLRELELVPVSEKYGETVRCKRAREVPGASKGRRGNSPSVAGTPPDPQQDAA